MWYLVQALAATVLAGGVSALQTTKQDNELQKCVQVYADGLDQVKFGLGDSIRAHPLEPVAISYRPIIFGAGSGSTGTRSLFFALRELGLDGWHWNPDALWEKTILDALGRDAREEFSSERKDECHKVLQTFNYTTLPEDVMFVTDEPVAEMFIDLFLAFPKARFILTVRPEAEWAESRLLHHGKWELPPLQEPCGDHFLQYTLQEIMQFEQLKNELVQCAVPNNRLMKLSLFTNPPDRVARLMQELGNFVGIPHGPDPFPVDDSEWKARRASLRRAVHRNGANE